MSRNKKERHMGIICLSCRAKNPRGYKTCFRCGSNLKKGKPYNDNKNLKRL
jgi:ribosomal protein L40E